MITFLRQVFEKNLDQDALVWQDRIYKYRELLNSLESLSLRMKEAKVGPNQVVALEADFSPNALVLMLALIEKRCVIVPLSSTVSAQKEEFCRIAEVERVISINENDEVEILSINQNVQTTQHPLIQTLKDRNHPGLILFSSGSTGKSKAALHDFVPLLEKFKRPRKTLRTLTFLLFDHIGGINTIFYTLANGGCAVTIKDRSPEAICQAIQTYQVELLPTSPTFINLLLLSEAWKRFELSSLKLVTYGTEVMPAPTLQRFHQLFPDIKLQQTYGLSEIGILSSKSRSADSLWLKIGGSGIEYRIVDKILQIKTPSAMLGYLNAPSPFTDDGWFDTGDEVEVDGDYIRILGRSSEIINVGGEKVWPAEVEDALLTMPGVEDVAVTGRANPITGQMVQARVKLNTNERLSDFRKRMRQYCKDRLPQYKIPQQVIIEEEGFHGSRFKKIRRQNSDTTK
ncbi:MAG: long-chain fatty acid--CoA ligase [Desulfamplus sp.]|nr:long-chain fatty acid--CoA ligase [Desulfamplus sp.]